MKILILTSSFPRFRGDFQGNFIFYQAQGQVEKGNEVHILCPHISGSPLSEEIDGLKVHRFRYFFPYRYQRLSSSTGMYSALRHSFLSVLQLPIFLMSQWLCAWDILHKHEIDLIHSHWFVPSGFVGSSLAYIWRKPHIITSHVLDANLFRKFRFFLPLLSVIAASADLITTNSSYTKRQIEDLVIIKCPLKVIPMGTSHIPRRFQRKGESDHTILFVGRLVEWKGVDTLIRAMMNVLKSFPDATLTIVGEGLIFEQLQNLVDVNGLSNSIFFTGRVNDEDLGKLYERSSVFVLPSQTYQGLVMEGLGVVLLEAMARGVPVIGSNIGGIPDIITHGENGFLVPEQNPAMLAEKIVALLSDAMLSERFRLEGYRTIKSRFTWSKVSQQFSESYERVLSEYSRGV